MFIVDQLLGVGNGARGGLAVRAQAPEHNFSFVYIKTMVVLRAQARRLTRMAVGIRDATAATAYQMVVVVTGTSFEAGGMTGRLDLAYQAGFHTYRQHIVDSLLGDRTNPRAYAVVHLIHGGMRMTDQPFKHCMTRRGYPQTVVAQLLNYWLAVFTHGSAIIRHFLE